MANRPITEQIDELKAKKTLLEGDRKAYYDVSQFAMKNNRDLIQQLRKENKAIRQRLSDSLSQDEHVINKAFHDKPVERASLKNKTGHTAITIMDYKVCDTLKQLNGLKHQSASRQKKMEYLQMQYNQMLTDASDAVATDKGESFDAQEMRRLENSHDKAHLKLHEARLLNRIYHQIRSKLQSDALGFNNMLNAMESEISQVKLEHNELQNMQNDASLSKEAATGELRKHEEMVLNERRQREVELATMKREAEEKKMQHERIEKRIANRGSMQTDEMTSLEKMGTMEDQQYKISTYDEAFKRIKEATGVSETQEVVMRFQNQGETTKHLEELKKEGEKQILRLKEEKQKLKDEFEEMKYSGEAKLSSGQRTLEEFESHLSKEEERRSEAEGKLSRVSRILVSVKAGVDHLAEKLHHLKATQSHVPTAQIPPSSDEYVLDQLSTCEEKLLKLLEQLDGKDLNEAFQQMEEEDEFHMNIENKLPMYNTRIKLPQTQRENVYDDEDESGEDDTEVPTRGTIKKQSQLIIDAKTKRRTTRKKKKTK